MSPDAVQPPPTLGNQYETDRGLQSLLRRLLPEAVHAAVEPELRAMGERAGGALYALQQSDLGAEPTLTRWGPWGDRVDRIEPTRVWTRAEKIAAREGVVATAYEQTHGRYSRLHQMALAYLFIPSTDMYGCPLAMTDGAARALLDNGRASVAEAAVPHLTARDPDAFWTSGQWMTEIAGGSDVSNTRTTARRDDEGTWRLYGRKWFTSAITANMALALARPAGLPEGHAEGHAEGSAGLALFYVPVHRHGTLAEGLYVHRLKDKMGTRKLPTAELQLDGVAARPVTDELRHGTRHIAPMLTVTRLWNAVTAAAYLRRGLALARDYARKRTAFGRRILDHPLHRDTLATLEAQLEGMMHLSFRVAALLGRRETDASTPSHRRLLRLLTPIAKLTTAKQAVAGTSEVLEAFGGAGYVEDTGLPPLHRDAQVLPIWEGTTNVLALDLVRGLQAENGLDLIGGDIERCRSAVHDAQLQAAVQTAHDAFAHAAAWFRSAQSDGHDALQAGARRFALTLGHALELAYTARHAQWALRTEQDERPKAAAERLAAGPIDRVSEHSATGADALVQ